MRRKVNGTAALMAVNKIALWLNQHGYKKRNGRKYIEQLCSCIVKKVNACAAIIKRSTKISANKLDVIGNNRFCRRKAVYTYSAYRLTASGL